MAQIPYDHVQNMLFIYTPHQALPEEHPCYPFDEIVERLDFSSFPDRTSTPESLSTTPGRSPLKPRRHFA